ncbi:hypothetical protein D8Y36_28335, partial [Escherichia coli]
PAAQHGGQLSEKKIVIPWRRFSGMRLLAEMITSQPAAQHGGQLSEKKIVIPWRRFSGMRLLAEMITS